ncbi:MAG: exodeoxyribonuclease VII large subunit [Deltaproteobacteria bacterium RBG_16_50_11]|nr:MAG: exodeoxyribonuclease VII large subunit [Deltaproteobacteria bacterium RBG_16_50_11]
MELPFRHVLKVSELTREIKDILEGKFYEIWVEGEISNLRIPPSGHIYFTLKDDFSQIRAVLFRLQARALRFVPEDGLHVICGGRVSVYEKRGEYQLILETMEPKGVGALQLAFLQLKERLEKEGFFAPGRKKPIPMFPQAIGIVTSPTGAVIRDMLNIIDRRFRNVRILLYPVRVQGEGAAFEIAAGIEYLNALNEVEVIIVGRGGGSIEDLWAFNEEEVARAIYHSKIPIISAVGHETDYTISDFVADLRAPTPSAAAELVVKDKREVKKILDHWEDRLENQMLQILEEIRSEVSYLRKRLRDPKKMIEESILKVDDFINRMSLSAVWVIRRKREKGLHLDQGLMLRNPIRGIENLRSFVSGLEKHLFQNIRYFLEMKKQTVRGVLGKLDSLSPLAVLERGYSITRKVPSLQILKDASGVVVGEEVEVRLHRGTLLCQVERTQGS